MTNKKQLEEKSIALKETTEPVIPEQVALPDWGVIEDLETTDLQVPKIFHQQAMSKFVAEGLARPGDFCDSVTGEVICKKEDKLEVIIFGSFKTMVISRLDIAKNIYVLHKVVTIDQENAKFWAAKPFLEHTEEGDFKNSLYYNFYCLVVNKINELPFVLSLGSTKTKAAKKLNTMIFKLSQLKKPGAAVVFELSSIQEKNERGSWFGLDVSQGRNSSAQELLRAHAWYLKSKSYTISAVQDEDETEEAPF